MRASWTYSPSGDVMTTNDQPSGIITGSVGTEEWPSQERPWRPKSSYRVRNNRAIIFQQTETDLPRFILLQEALRPITRTQRLPSKTEVFRAAMEVALMAERQDPGVLARVLCDMRLQPTQEVSLPEERPILLGLAVELKLGVDSVLE